MILPDATPTLADIRAAAEVLEGRVQVTPLIGCPTLSTRARQPVFLKLETLQPTGAFKLRGATNAIHALSEQQRQRGVACCSTGNHGRAVAYAAAEAGIRAIVCLSSLVPETKVRAIEALGAEVRRVGNSQDDAQREVDRLVQAEGMTDIPPFDHPAVIAGQGTIALELLDQHPDLATIVVPLSGGGLVSGIALAAKAMKPDIRIVGISMARGAAMHASLEAGKPVAVTELPTLADSLGGGIGLDNRWTFAICRALVDDVILLSEVEIYRGMRALFTEHRLVTEGAAAVGVGALLAGKLKLNGPTALIISGHNVALEQFLAVTSGQPVTIGDQTIKEE
jgi:threonine dehydratase